MLFLRELPCAEAIWSQCCIEESDSVSVFSEPMLPQAVLEGTLVGFLEFRLAIKTCMSVNVGRGRGQETQVIYRVDISSSVNVAFLASWRALLTIQLRSQ